MKDAVHDLADDVKNATIEAAAKVAEIHRIRWPENTWQEGYNAAVADIAKKIRELR